MSKNYGIIVTIRECAKCFRILDLTSGDDCPNHTLHCCGGKGTLHELGCREDSMYKAGVEWAIKRGKEFWERMGIKL